MNVLVGYMLLWVLFASVMLGAGDQIFHGLHHGLWYLRFDGTWPELGQVGGATGHGPQVMAHTGHGPQVMAHTGHGPHRPWAQEE